MTDLDRGRITDESLEKMRRRIGYPNPTVRSGVVELPWNTEASFDAIRHYAESYGDSNPLYTTRDYGEKTRWGSQIAPPTFESTMGFNCSPRPPPDVEQETRGALRGVQLYHSGTDERFFRPVVPGDVLYQSTVVVDVEEKRSEFAGRSVIVTNERTCWNERREVVSVDRHWFVHAERKAVSGTDKYAGDEPARYTDEQIAEIERLYDEELVRGPDTLWFEEVEVGDELPTMVKGPLTVTDLINVHMGSGWLGYGNPPLRLAYENRKKLRGFYTRNEFNYWDVVQRVHWEPALARQVGVPSSYDIGPVRWSWCAHYCTNYGGDDSWLARLRVEFRRFNYTGDTTWLTGRVVARRLRQGAAPEIDIEMKGTNQRGQVTTKGEATIMLASRKHGAVVLPAPPSPPAGASAP